MADFALSVAPMLLLNLELFVFLDNLKKIPRPLQLGHLFPVIGPI